MPKPDRTIDALSAIQLSGGMRQRAMIAMALSCHPSLLIADEPTTALDVTTEAQILDLMRQLQHELGMAIMYITHNLGVIAEMADNVVVMYMGKEVEQADVRDALLRPAASLHAGAAALHPAAWPKIRTAAGVIRAWCPIRTRSRGCPFHPRCASKFMQAGCRPPRAPSPLSNSGGPEPGLERPNAML